MSREGNGRSVSPDELTSQIIVNKTNVNIKPCVAV